jgi:hypothetical protein
MLVCKGALQPLHSFQSLHVGGGRDVGCGMGGCELVRLCVCGGMWDVGWRRGRCGT